MFQEFNNKEYTFVKDNNIVSFYKLENDRTDSTLVLRIVIEIDDIIRIKNVLYDETESTEEIINLVAMLYV